VILILHVQIFWLGTAAVLMLQIPDCFLTVACLLLSIHSVLFVHFWRLLCGDRCRISQVVQTVDEPHMLELREGDYVQVLEWRPTDNLAICRTAAEEIGFYVS
jgi:membrane protein implicated in regulation of membrane protease activity